MKSILIVFSLLLIGCSTRNELTYVGIGSRVDRTKTYAGCYVDRHGNLKPFYLPE